MPKFSVVVPAYNSAGFIRATLGSVLNQTLENFEIIVVDDGSSDGTADIVRSLGRQIRVIKQSNQGIAVARNVGVENSHGEWVAFIDHDDLWHPQKLAVQAEIIEGKSDCGVVFGEFKRWHSGTPPVFPDQDLAANEISQELSGFILPKLIETNWVLLSTAAFRRDVFETIGYFDPEMPPADDWDFVLRAAEVFNFIKLSQTLALYRVHSGQTSLKLTPSNVEYDLREKFLARLDEIGGDKPDMLEIKRRQYHALFNYGLALYKHGHYNRARSSFNRAFRLDPSSKKAVYYLIASVLKGLLK